MSDLWPSGFVSQEVKSEQLPTPVKTTVALAVTPGVKKEVNQWYDVGIIKGTSCVVSHYHLPSEAGQGNGDVSLILIILQ